jgi:hypothetical protein
MPKTSLIYRNLFWYRFGMNLLYAGRYRRRFDPIVQELGKILPASVTEFCFGDIHIARWCVNNGIAWKGIDLNPEFVRFAIANGFLAQQADVLELPVYPQTEMGIIAGALYHFTEAELCGFLEKIFLSTPVLLVSEPVRNLSNTLGLAGKIIAGVLTRTAKREVHFRYTRETLLGILDKRSKELNFSVRVVKEYKNDIILILTKN